MKEDKREYHLRVAQKYLNYYNISYQYLDTVLTRLEDLFTPEELETVAKVLKVMDEELMPDIPLPHELQSHRLRLPLQFVGASLYEHPRLRKRQEYLFL